MSCFTQHASRVALPSTLQKCNSQDLVMVMTCEDVLITTTFFKGCITCINLGSHILLEDVLIATKFFKGCITHV